MVCLIIPQLQVGLSLCRNCSLPNLDGEEEVTYLLIRSVSELTNRSIYLSLGFFLKNQCKNPVNGRQGIDEQKLTPNVRKKCHSNLLKIETHIHGENNHELFSWNHKSKEE
jgi:hypothetical protein